MVVENPQHSNQPRYNVDLLKKEVDSGKNIYTVIGGVLRQESVRMHKLHTRRYVNGGVNPDDFVRSGFVDLPSATIEADIILFSASDEGHVNGFDHVATHLYPIIEAAPNFTPGDQQLFPPGTVFAFAVELAAFPSLNDLESGGVLNTLKVDPTGFTWLNRKIHNKYNESTREIIGAKRAASGARDLYNLLRG